MSQQPPAPQEGPALRRGDKIDPYKENILESEIEPGQQEQRPQKPRQINSTWIKAAMIASTLFVLLGIYLATFTGEEQAKPEQEVDRAQVVIDPKTAQEQAAEQLRKKQEAAKRAEEEEAKKKLARAQSQPEATSHQEAEPETPALDSSRQAELDRLFGGQEVAPSNASESGGVGTAQKDDEDPWVRARRAHRERRAQQYFANMDAALDGPLAFPGLAPGAFSEKELRQPSRPHNDLTHLSASEQMLEPNTPEERRRAYLNSLSQIRSSPSLAPRGGAVGGIGSVSGVRGSELGAASHGVGARGYAAGATPSGVAAPGAAARLGAPDVAAGTLVHLVLESGIHSEHSGMVLARVAMPVWDAHMQHIVLRSGTRLRGTLMTRRVDHGSTRLIVMFDHIELDAGRWVPMPASPGVDLDGSTGLPSQVDEHWDDVLIGTAISAGLGAASGALAGPVDSTQIRPGQQALYGAGRDSSRAADKIASRLLELKPVLSVPAGKRIGMLVAQDLFLSNASGSGVTLGGEMR